MILGHEVAGDEHASVVVLVHGITENRETWRPVIDALAHRHRVLAVDLRGHGVSGRQPPYDALTYAADVAETIAALGLRDPLLVGHSLGGVVVTAVPASCPDVVGVVNVDQPLALGGFRTALQALEPQLRGTRDEFVGAIGAVFESMSPPLTGDGLARVARERRPEQDVVLGTWSIVLEASPSELDAAADAIGAAVGDRPYLSLHGIDPGPDYGEWLRARVPQAVVEVWPDHGHYPFLVDERRFLERLSAFDQQVRG